MGYVEVIVIGPDNRKYDASINANADEQSLVAELVHSLRLPTVDKKTNAPIEYRINLLGGTRIREGSVLQLSEIRRPDVKWIRPRDEG